MSVSYVIAAVILASIVASVVFVLIGKIEHKTRHLNINWFLLMALIAISCVLCMVLIYHAENDLTLEDTQQTYNNGYEDGVASAQHTLPSIEEMEQWFSSTEEVVVGTNGSDWSVHIIDHAGEEWVLYADEVEK